MLSIGGLGNSQEVVDNSMIVWVFYEMLDQAIIFLNQHKVQARKSDIFVVGFFTIFRSAKVSFKKYHVVWRIKWVEKLSVD